MRDFRRISVFGVAALALVAGGCVNRAAQSQGKRTEQILSDPVRPVQVALVTSKQIADTLEITGQVATSEEGTIGAKQPGRIIAVYVKDGDSVSAGQLVASQETTTQNIQMRQAQAQVSAARSALSQALSNAAIGPSRSAAAVRSAQAAVRQAQSQLAKVRAGARPEERAQAAAAVEAAKSNMETAQRNLERQQTLLAQKAVSQAQVDQARNAYQTALSQYQQALEALRLIQNGSRAEDIASAEQQVSQAQEAVASAKASQKLDVLLGQQVEAARANVRAAEAQVSQAQQAIADAQIRAPYSGKIAGNPIQPGAVVGAGTTVARLIGAQGSYFEGEVPSSEINQIQPGSSVQVRVEALPNRTFVGNVAAISPSATEVGRLFTVRIQLASAPAEVRPGMFARGTITLRQVNAEAVVPATAIVRRSGESYVFLVKAGAAKRLPVTVGLRQGDIVQVKGEIGPGDQVVVRGQSELDEGTKVKIETPPAETPPAGDEGGAA